MFSHLSICVRDVCIGKSTHCILFVECLKLKLERVVHSGRCRRALELAHSSHRESTTRRGSAGQCSCDSTRSALALESQVVSRREAAAAVGSSQRARVASLRQYSRCGARTPHAVLARATGRYARGPVVAAAPLTHSLPVAALLCPTITRLIEHHILV